MLKTSGRKENFEHDKEELNEEAKEEHDATFTKRF